MSAQRLDDGDFELVVVDNASTDDTQTVVRRAMSDLTGCTITYVPEETLGLSVARNTGFGRARGALIVFLDDDAVPGDGWLQSLVECSRRTGAQVVGGPVDLRFETEPPPWLTAQHRLALTELDWGTEERILRLPEEWLVGANVAFDRRVFSRFSFDAALGRKGSSLASGEEVALCWWVQQAGDEVRYVPGARVEHFVPSERLTHGFMRRRVLAGAASGVVMERLVTGRLPGMRRLAGAAKMLLRAALKLARGRVGGRRDADAGREAMAALGFIRGWITALRYGDPDQGDPPREQ